MKMTRLERSSGSFAAPSRPHLWADDALAHSPLDASIASAMRFPTIVTARTPLSRTADLFVRANVCLAVVVDEHRHPLGVVTPVDVLALARRLGSFGIDSSAALDAARSGGRLMPESTTLGDAHAALLDENREFFLVVGPDGRLAGLITAMDVLEALNEAPPRSGTRHVAPVPR